MAQYQPPLKLQPGKTGGCKRIAKISVAGTNLFQVKAYPTTMFGIHIEGVANAPAAYLKLFNSVLSPVLGVTKAFDQFCCLAGTSTSGTIHEFGHVLGVQYSQGLWVAVTGGISLTDATAVSANQYNFTIYYI